MTMFCTIRRTLWSGYSQVRALHFKNQPNLEPHLSNRDELPIINKPAYQNKIQKVRRAIHVEETMTYKRSSMKKKKKKSTQAT